MFKKAPVFEGVLSYRGVEARWKPARAAQLRECSGACGEDVIQYLSISLSRRLARTSQRVDSTGKYYTNDEYK